METGLTHFDATGNAVMVDVSEKIATTRIAEARGTIKVNEAVYKAVETGTAKKGDVLGVARIAGIMAAKKTSELIPMCHPLMITKCTVDFVLCPESLSIEAKCLVKVNGQTGVEMEALTGVNVALLTIYDMCKAMDKGMIISDISLIEKQGGKSGHYKRKEPKVFAVSGIKNSGKTTLIEKLIRELTKEGYKVGVIKHDGHDFEIDHEGTDSFRHKKSGAKNVIVYSKNKVMMVKEISKPSIKALIDLEQDMDLIILEGMKHSEFPKIEVVRGEISKRPVCKEETLLAIATDVPMTKEEIPIVDLNDIDGIVAIIKAFIQ